MKWTRYRKQDGKARVGVPKVSERMTCDKVVVEHNRPYGLSLLHAQVFEIACLQRALVVLYQHSLILCSLEAPYDNFLP
ncbi:MAG: hypothetical protein ACPHHQ_05670, partial [Pseudomonadales bacterium]